MTDRVPPNPHSPYADADPDMRHLVPELFGILPAPGVLALVACERLAVVPAEPLTDVHDLLTAGRTDELPPGLCPDCIGAATGIATPLPPVPGTCRECEGASRHGDLCALCRQELHDGWWHTRDQTGPTIKEPTR